MLQGILHTIRYCRSLHTGLLQLALLVIHVGFHFTHDLHHSAGRLHDILDDLLDLGCGALRLVSQLTDLLCYHCKASSRFSGSGCFNAGIQ